MELATSDVPTGDTSDWLLNAEVAGFGHPCRAGKLATPLKSARKLALLSYLPQLPAASDYLVPTFGPRCARLESTRNTIPWTASMAC